jgi:hypothetical protein
MQGLGRYDAHDKINQFALAPHESVGQSTQSQTLHWLNARLPLNFE